MIMQANLQITARYILLLIKFLLYQPLILHINYGMMENHIWLTCAPRVVQNMFTIKL